MAAGSIVISQLAHRLLPSSPCSSKIASPPLHANKLQLHATPPDASQNRGRHVSVRLSIGHSFEPWDDDDATILSFIESTEQIQDGSRLHARVASELVDAGASTSVQDWRTFRAKLCKANSGHAELVSRESFGHADERWAHEITMPEVGCILLATEKLDKHPLLHKSVVLLLHSNCGDFRGVMLNRKLPFALEQVNNVDMGVILGLRACPVFLGGPISSSTAFHLLSPLFLQGFTPVLPGLRVGADQQALFSCWDSIKRNEITDKDVHVHIGEMEWDLVSLATEVKVLEWWRIVSCSTSLLLQEDVECMWESIDSLTSMG